jgi:hypothetical protein
VPRLVEIFKLDVTVPQCRAKVRELFLRNGEVKDHRVVDMLVAKVRRAQAGQEQGRWCR